MIDSCRSVELRQMRLPRSFVRVIPTGIILPKPERGGGVISHWFKTKGWYLLPNAQ